MRTRGAAGPGGDADDPVDDEIREQEAMDADEGELYFGPEQVAEGVAGVHVLIALGQAAPLL